MGGSRSVNGPGMFERSQRSVEREVGAGGDFKAKRTASAQGLDRSTEGEENGIINSSGHTAHRRRTDLVPTLVMSRNDGMSRSGTPSSSKHRSPVGTPKADRMKRARSVTSDTGGIEDDNRSTTSSQSVGPTNRTPTRKTPSQVKAEAAARKAKATAGKPAVSTPKSSLGSRGAAERK